MLITTLEAMNFKNIGEARLDFSEGVNCFVGRNGMGKSNLLEGIHFLSMARPMQSMPESGLIRHGEDMLLVKGHYLTDAGGDEDVSIGIKRGKGKTLLRNGKEYGKLSEHIGRFPIVAVTPADSMLVTGSGEMRRKLLDMVISQTDRRYLAELIRYNRGLESRNWMLRAGVRDKLLYEGVLGFTHQGVHRDDLCMELRGHSMRRVGSQGQLKSYVIALRLAIYEHLCDVTGVKPILLLDDIFDKLDSERVGRIMRTVSSGNFGQIFITDTNREHLDETVSTLVGPSRMYEVEEGRFTVL